MSIFFIGPLPPPVHGFSVINAAMLERLQRETDVTIFNRAPPSGTQHSTLQSFASWLKLLARFCLALLSKKPAALYAGISGGMGQLLDLPFFLLARLASLPIFVHHHSFAYLNAPSWLSRIVFLVLRNANHIVLCTDMGTKLCETYAISPSHTSVLSNSAFIPTLAADRKVAGRVHSQRHTVTIGFLSNITEEKGIFEFFDVIQRANEMNIDIAAYIAGPVSHEVRLRFDEALSSASNTTHVGAVYGHDKIKFLQQLDLLLFPTKYVNEAEPVTIFEALQCGVEVMAIQRGCICNMLPQQCGNVVEQRHFCNSALKRIIALSRSRIEDRILARLGIANHFDVLHKDSNQQLDSIISRMTMQPK